MTLDECYAVLRRRDRAFDGRLYVGVVTTGIYCRPVCTARLPRLENVRFYPSGAAAAVAGFRACKRCKPTATPARFPAEAPVVRLAYRPPLDWSRLLAFLAPRATPGIEVVDGDVYRRTTPAGVVAVRKRGGVLEMAGTDPAPLVARARRLFGLDVSPRRVAAGLGRDETLAPLVRRARGLRVPGAWDTYELAVRAVLGQQVTVRGATTLAGRLVRAFGTPLADGEPGLSHLFPAPAVLADADLATIGLPRARAETIRNLAAAVARGDLDLDASRGLDATIAALTALPGIGEWTAHYVAMRGLGEPDAFPAGDLGLRRALGNGAGPIPAKELAQIAERWRPWRAYAAMHLWSAA